MTNLTEQLKKGELPDNHHYYFKLPKSKEYEVGNTFCLETLRWCKDGNKIQIIREVPSYKELITIISKNDMLRQENTKLRQLLKLNNVLNKGSKAIYAWLKEDTAGEQKKLCADMFDKTVEMMSEINQVLVEE